MQALSHNVPFSRAGETRNLILVTNGVLVTVELEVDGQYEPIITRTENDVVTIDFTGDMKWRVNMSDSGAATKAYLSDKR